MAVDRRRIRGWTGFFVAGVLAIAGWVLLTILAVCFEFWVMFDVILG